MSDRLTGYLRWRQEEVKAPTRAMGARNALVLIERGIEALHNVDAAGTKRDALDVAIDRFLLEFDRTFPRYAGRGEKECELGALLSAVSAAEIGEDG